MFEKAQRVEYEDDDEPMQCPICGSENSYIKWKFEKMCEDCGHVRGGQQSRGQRNRTSEWERWWEHRRSSDEYSGFRGENRIKMVGGFVGPWDFEKDL
jgi:transcription initiation factor TFIIIB Brf1 subunit/transcription initiation factor TFIIB